MTKKKYGTLFNPDQTPQSEPLAGRETEQVENNAGGFVFKIDNWKRLERFLILGSDAPTYYQKAQALTRENGKVVMDCWGKDPERTAAVICDISHSGRAPRQSPAIFALALGAIHDKVEARTEAYKAVQIVCRTASHLFEWMQACKDLGKGSGSGFKHTIQNWYAARPTDTLAFQMIKFRERNGYNHKRAIELSNKGAGEDEARKALYLWARGKDPHPSELPAIVQAHLKVMAAKSATKVALGLIEKHKLPWEAIPTQFLKEGKVWEVMQPFMGMTALIRNLAAMTEAGAIDDGKTQAVVDRLVDAEALRKARVHPFQVLLALTAYKQGRSITARAFGKEGRRWTPQPKIVDALDAAFYAAFQTVEPTGKRIYLGVDVSGSMGAPIMGTALSCYEAAAALALVTASVEKHADIYGFSTKMKRLNITPRMRLDQAVDVLHRCGMGSGTDCAMPMLHAIKKDLKVDLFVIATDNETWAGNIHPVEALKQYRKKSGINAKCVVLGMTSTGFSIADQNDGGMLDICGMDANVPAIINDFSKS